MQTTTTPTQTPRPSTPSASPTRPSPAPSTTTAPAQQAGPAQPVTGSLELHYTTAQGFSACLRLALTAPTADDLLALADRATRRLEAQGATPATAQQPAAPAPASPSTTPPICPEHGRPMKKSSARPGTWYCTAKMTDGAYCRHKAE